MQVFEISEGEQMLFFGRFQLVWAMGGKACLAAADDHETADDLRMTVRWLKKRLDTRADFGVKRSAMDKQLIKELLAIGINTQRKRSDCGCAVCDGLELAEKIMAMLSPLFGESEPANDEARILMAAAAEVKQCCPDCCGD